MEKDALTAQAHDALTFSSKELTVDDALLAKEGLKGPCLVTLDGDQTLYSDGANFDSNPRLAFYLYQLLRHKVSVAVVTAAGYDYNVERYEHRLSGLLAYFEQRGLSEEECGRFYLVSGATFLPLLLQPTHMQFSLAESATTCCASVKTIVCIPSKRMVLVDG